MPETKDKNKEISIFPSHTRFKRNISKKQGTILGEK